MTEEADWIRRAQRGDAEAWERLVQEHQQAVFRLAYLHLGDADDAEDVAQEAFIRACRALGGFDASRPLRPWLLRIVTNLAHNWRRSAARYFFSLQRLLRAEQPLLEPSTGEADSDQAEDLWRAVRRMRADDQKIIYLRFFLECSEAETAQALGVAVGTVKSRMHRALNRLRAILRDEFPQIEEEHADAG